MTLAKSIVLLDAFADLRRWLQDERVECLMFHVDGGVKEVRKQSPPGELEDVVARCTNATTVCSPVLYLLAALSGAGNAYRRERACIRRPSYFWNVYVDPAGLALFLHPGPRTDAARKLPCIKDLFEQGDGV